MGAVKSWLYDLEEWNYTSEYFIFDLQRFKSGEVVIYKRQNRKTSMCLSTEEAGNLARMLTVLKVG